MKKIAFILLFYVSSSFAVTGLTYGWTVNTSKDTVTASKLKKNYDSIQNYCTRVKDTLNKTVPRWNMILRNHDSVWTYQNIDTIPSADTINVINLKVAKIDSVYSSKGVRATNATFTSTATVDSLKSTKGINATTGTFSGKITAGGSATVDSLYSAKGIKAITGAMQAGQGVFTEASIYQLYLKYSPTDSIKMVDSARYFNTGDSIKCKKLLTDTTQCKIVKADTVRIKKLASDTINGVYAISRDTAFVCSLFSQGTIDTFKTSATGRIIIIGNKVMIYVPYLHAVMRGVPTISVPSYATVTTSQYIPTVIIDNAVPLSGFVKTSANLAHFPLYRYDSGGFTAGGDAGSYPTAFTYVK